MIIKITVILVFLAVLSSEAIFAQQPRHVYSIPNMTFEMEKRWLRQAAVELKQHPDKIVYLVAYNKAGQRKSTATRRLLQSKQYLIRDQRIASSRIRTVYGGSREDGLVMNIFVVEPDDKSVSLSGKQASAL